MPRLTLLVTIIIISLLFQSCGKGRLCCFIPTETYRHVAGTLVTDKNITWSETNFKDTIRNDSLTIWSNRPGTEYTFRLKLSIKKDGAKNEFNVYEKIPETVIYSDTFGSNNILTYILDTTFKNTMAIRFENGDTEANQGQWVLGRFELRYKLAKPTGVLRVDTAHINFRGSFGVKLAK
ncbi:MAG: hypothetical protein V4619_14480 [Bacteroidota bacterium]